MKIAVFHELQSGGARRAVNEISKRLKKGNIVDLYLIDQNLDKSESKFFTKIFFNKFVPKKWKGHSPLIKLQKDTTELLYLYKLHKKIAKQIDSKNYDFVFVHPSKFTQAPFVLRFLKTKKIYYSQETLRMVYEKQDVVNLNLFKKYYENLNRKVRKQIDKKNIKSADLVLANSNFTKNNILKAYNLNSKVAYLGVDTNFFKPGKVKDIDILYIGSKDKNDGYDLLNKSLEHLKIQPKVFYLINGEKWIDEPQLRNLYSNAKIVFTFYKNEPFGLIPLEAMSSGAVVLALNQGGYKETVIDTKTGYLLPNDPKIVAKKIEYLLSNTNTLANMGKYSRKLMEEKWSWDKRVKDLEKVFTIFLN